MDENSFLKNYNAGGGDAKPAGETVGTVQNDGAEKSESGFRYEQKSSFIAPPKKGGPGGSTPRKPPKLMVPILGGAAAVIVIVVLILVFTSRGVPVINLTGWTLNDAYLWADEKGVRLQEEEVYNDAYEEGVVFGQDVEEGARVKKGDFIKVTVSMGHDLSVTLPLPDLMSMNMDSIEAWADENYMTKVRITSEYNETVPEGEVIRYEINDNTVVEQVRRDTPIYVIVSKGVEDPSTVQITVPDFKSMALSACYAFANDNGITLDVNEEYDDYVPKGTIISQSVKAEQKVTKGSEIKLVISKGKKITMPDLSSYTKEKATAVVNGLGIPLTIVDKYSGAAAGKFISQSIKAGTIYNGEDVLELNYSLGNTITVASFVGQTRDAIETWASGLNEQGASIKINVIYTASNSAAGTIVYQDKASTVIAPSDTINISVSQGKVVYVPDFVGPKGAGYDQAITRDRAIQMCEDINIIPVFVEENNTGRLPGEVWEQSIAAGAEVNAGTTITLKYRPANVQHTVSKYIGKTKATVLEDKDKFYFVFDCPDGYNDTWVVKAQSIPFRTTATAGTKITLTMGAPSSPSTPAATYTVTVNKTGSGEVSGAGSYAAGATVTLIASPDPGYHLDHWEGGPIDDSTELTATFTMPSNNVTVTAVFVVD